ncbi:hypothetical protein [Paraliomyxa miuraensis]|uniref:hypothetical protein n=1 Tax=Paraliomyxa miuraensis TaxID=376150 RepID=UPI00224C81C7|nr:hypothetical protein [Paraliomyxa miuraensis]MCX4242521.1 hypothetical protein [Paraliomyxa miuraensis]
MSNGRCLLPLLTVTLGLVFACHGGDLDAPGNHSTSAADGGGSTSAFEDSGALDETAGADETGGFPQAEVPCQMAGMYGVYDAHFEASRYPIIVEEDCGPVGLLWQVGVGPKLNGLMEPDDFEIVVHHPAPLVGAPPDECNPQNTHDNPPDSWPPSDIGFPSAFFGPGNGLRSIALGAMPPLSPGQHFYDTLAEDLARRGMVVFSIQPPNNSNWSSEKREKALACAMHWARDPNATNPWSGDDDDPPRLAHSTFVVGHSRSGSGAYLLPASFDSYAASLSTTIGEYELCSHAAIAQRYGDGTMAGAGDPTDVGPITDVSAPPFLGLLGSIDDDTLGDQVAAYDNRLSDDAFSSPQDPAAAAENDAVLANVFGVTHTDWGGVTRTVGSHYGRAIGDVLGPFFVGRFAAWTVFQDATAREEILRSADLPSEGGNPTDGFHCALTSVDWQGPLVDFHDLVQQRPLTFIDYTQGHAPPGADRFMIDNLHRPIFGCGPNLGASTLGGAVAVSGSGGNACTNFGAALYDDLSDSSYFSHDTAALRVDYGGNPMDELVVEWSLEDDGAPLAGIGGFTHLSLRAGRIYENLDSEECKTEHAALSFAIDLVDSSGVGQASTVITEPILEPHDEQTIYQGDMNCRAHHFMQTIRIPLTRFAPIAIEDLGAIRLRFSSDQAQHVLVDTIEFTRDPSSMGLVAPSYRDTAWNCPATAGLTPVEKSCMVEPHKGSCGSTTISPVVVPTVHGPPGDSFAGWVVHAPKGWVLDPNHPTTKELDLITQACVEACDLEWSDDRDVHANCTAPGAFSTPSLRLTSAIGPTQRIPDSRADGHGIFPGQALACDLEGDCCEVFDEAVCAARAKRTTEARQPLHRGEEHLIELGGDEDGSRIEFITPNASTSMSLSGELGYSVCPDGETGTTCPFYLGSLFLTSTNQATIADTCPDGSPLLLNVGDLDVQLLQPAMAIADANSYTKAFPTGALLLQADLTVDGVPYTVRGVNEELVTLTAGHAGLFAAKLDASVPIPCGDDVLPLTIRFELATQSVLGEPPIAAITTPAAVPCPTMLPLTSSVADPDDDFDHVRWYVDDVLVHPDVSILAMTTDHELRLLAVDARGAATTVTRSVACQ